MGCRSSPLKLGAVRVLGMQGLGREAAPTTPGRVGTARRSGSGTQDEKVQQVVNQCQNLLKRGTGSNLTDVGRAAVRAVYFGCGWRLRSRLRMPVGRLFGRVCGAPGSEAAGAELGVSLVERNIVNMGTRSGVVPPAALPVWREGRSSAD